MNHPSEEYESRSDETSNTGSAEEDETSSTSSAENGNPTAATGHVRNGVPSSSRPDAAAVIQPGSNSGNAPSPAPLDAAVAGARIISNSPMDERVDVHDGDNIATPRALQAVHSHHSGSDEDENDENSSAESEDKQGTQRPSDEHNGHKLFLNAPHDEAIPIAKDSEENEVATPVADRQPPQQQQQQQQEQDKEPQQWPQRQAGHAQGRPGGAMVPADEDEEEEAEEEEEEEEEAEEAGTPQQQYRPNLGGQTPAAIEQIPADQQQGQPALPNREYNPAKYARVNAKASREMQELFKHILDYQPFVAELPAKLRPFIPDYIPAVGDLDPFVKVPRPDGHPDGLGLYVVDEPAIPQSNPAVVQLELRATNAHGSGGAAQVVDSFEDAANRPEVIDRWINDVKKVHYKKPLPTVVYQKPMPEIDTLLQAWPQMFEDVLNSDVQFPSSNIDLDLSQYVRTLCAILDIPTHTSLIDSLHIMFTLYEEFRGNQHFQHE